jgi:hypothetical protein
VTLGGYLGGRAVDGPANPSLEISSRWHSAPPSAGNRTFRARSTAARAAPKRGGCCRSISLTLARIRAGGASATAMSMTARLTATCAQVCTSQSLSSSSAAFRSPSMTATTSAAAMRPGSSVRRGLGKAGSPCAGCGHASLDTNRSPGRARYSRRVRPGRDRRRSRGPGGTVPEQAADVQTAPQVRRGALARCRSTARTRAGAGAAGSGRARWTACSPARSRSGPG